MFLTKERTVRLHELAEQIEIPPSYYEKAVRRYKSISEWLCREGSLTAQYEPIVSVQGSFRLGLVNRPIGPKEEYDLDLVCKLLKLSKLDISQEQLKVLLGAEIRGYAKAHGILEPVVERKRCWRIDYADEVNFHIDNLACIPEDFDLILTLSKLDVPIAIAQQAIALTCTEHPTYKTISNTWPTSNPGGFALWFEGRFGTAGALRRQFLVESGVYRSIDDVPTYALKTPLQTSIQILKRHRDFMYRGRPDLKPISMIITTLAGQAYEGEENIAEALEGILRRMPRFVRPEWPKVPNPVNPGEDFADKWRAKPALEQNFWDWYKQVCRDFEALTELEHPEELQKLTEASWGIKLPSTKTVPTVPSASKRVAPMIIVEQAPKPWADNGQNPNKAPR
jgi:hypothetical protein